MTGPSEQERQLNWRQIAAIVLEATIILAFVIVVVVATG